MGKIICACGQVIFDQSDLVINKAHVIADQDYMDFFAEVVGEEFMQMTAKAIKYFNEIFQCDKCNRLIIFRQDFNEGVFFIPENTNESKKILRSYLGDSWLGVMYANFMNGQGDVHWMTNLESGYRQNLSLFDLKEFYYNKLQELTRLKILRLSFLRVDNNIEHRFDYNQNSSS